MKVKGMPSCGHWSNYDASYMRLQDLSSSQVWQRGRLPEFIPAFLQPGRIAEAIYLANWELNHPGQFETGLGQNAQLEVTWVVIRRYSKLWDVGSRDLVVALFVRTSWF